MRRDIPTQTLSDTCARPSASRRGAHNETRLRRGFAGLRLCESSANDRGEGQASSARRDGVSNPRVVLLGRGVTPPLHRRGGCLPAARALEASAAEASPAEASAELGAPRRVRRRVRRHERATASSTACASAPRSRSAHASTSGERSAAGPQAGTPAPRTTRAPPTPTLRTTTPSPRKRRWTACTQLLDRASKVKLGPADAHSKDDATLPSDSAANTATPPPRTPPPRRPPPRRPSPRRPSPNPSSRNLRR